MKYQVELLQTNTWMHWWSSWRVKSSSTYGQHSEPAYVQMFGPKKGLLITAHFLGQKDILYGAAMPSSNTDNKLMNSTIFAHHLHDYSYTIA